MQTQIVLPCNIKIGQKYWIFALVYEITSKIDLLCFIIICEQKTIFFSSKIVFSKALVLMNFLHEATQLIKYFHFHQIWFTQYVLQRLFENNCLNWQTKIYHDFHDEKKFRAKVWSIWCNSFFGIFRWFFVQTCKHKLFYPAISKSVKNIEYLHLYIKSQVKLICCVLLSFVSKKQFFFQAKLFFQKRLCWWIFCMKQHNWSNIFIFTKFDSRNTFCRDFLKIIVEIGRQKFIMISTMKKNLEPKFGRFGAIRFLAFFDDFSCKHANTDCFTLQYQNRSKILNICTCISNHK